MRKMKYLLNHKMLSGYEALSYNSVDMENQTLNSSDICEESRLDEQKVGCSGFDSVDQKKAEDLGGDYIEIQILAADSVHKSRFDSDSDFDLDDVLLEHQNFVKQMKAEMRSGRNGGILPTISEESEAFTEEFKPLEIERKVEYKDVMEEVQKFYRCYSEKMRKLDVLSYQTSQAISFLQLKDSEIPTTNRANRSECVSFKFPTTWMCYSSKVHDDPLHKSMNQMNCDLELVYVGQLCLSWEILNWCSAKTQQLIHYDSNMKRSYNKAAERFQQFQVVLQRFIEEEQFTGERIQNYIERRRLISTLLHVPNIKDDSSKSKQDQTDTNDAISIKDLVEIIAESELIFRDFLYADKKSSNGVGSSKPEHRETPQYSELLSNIIATLHQRERRIREWRRKGRWGVKKEQEIRSSLNREVEVRLVTRVLNMSRLTVDQLVWCKTKLDNMNFVSKDVHLEPSFLVFPC